MEATVYAQQSSAVTVVSFLLLSLYPKLSISFVLLYNTEDSLLLQYYDCIYYTLPINAIQSVKYCQQLVESRKWSRSFTNYDSCSDRGGLHSFSTLKHMNVSTNEVLRWSSSVEKADKYAKYLFSNSPLDDSFICNCSESSVFGKFCEYQFYFEWETFDEAILAQFKPIVDHDIGSQLHNNRPCYQTHFECDYGLMCLVWSNICDGKFTTKMWRLGIFSQKIK
jgi:hypothetical protein